MNNSTSFSLNAENHFFWNLKVCNNTLLRCAQIWTKLETKELNEWRIKYRIFLQINIIKEVVDIHLCVLIV